MTRILILFHMVCALHLPCAACHALMRFILVIHVDNAVEQQIFSTSKFVFCLWQTNSSNSSIIFVQSMSVALSFVAPCMHALNRKNADQVVQTRDTNQMAIVFYHSSFNTIAVCVCVCVCLRWMYETRKLHLISFINFQLVCVLWFPSAPNRMDEWMNLHCIENVCTFYFLRLRRLIFIGIVAKKARGVRSINRHHSMESCFVQFLMIATTKNV